METRKNSNGLETFMEHWGRVVVVIVTLLGLQIFMFFSNLSGTPWICVCVAGFVLQISGAVLILYAKIPVYRSGRYFTFGIKSVPESLAGFYRWGWRLFLFGVVLSLCLLLSGQ